MVGVKQLNVYGSYSKNVCIQTTIRESQDFFSFILFKEQVLWTFHCRRPVNHNNQSLAHSTAYIGLVHWQAARQEEMFYDFKSMSPFFKLLSQTMKICHINDWQDRLYSGKRYTSLYNSKLWKIIWYSSDTLADEEFTYSIKELM